MTARNNVRPVRLAGIVFPALLLATFLAAGPASSAPPRVAGKCVTATGTLLRRTEGRHTWEPVPTGDAISAGDHLLALPGDKGTLESADGGVSATLWGNTPALGPWPPLESAVAVKAGDGNGLDLVLDRGRVFFTRGGESGSHRVRVQLGDHHWTIRLEEPGTEVSIERVSGWPRGTRFSLKREPHDLPRSAVSLWVLKGAALLQVGSEQFSLHAPPGPAFFGWNSSRGNDAGPTRREQVPAWLEEGSGTDAKKQEIRAAVQARRQRLREGPADQALAAGLTDTDGQARDLAVYGLAAIGAWKHVARALNESEHADVREAAIRALINWLGRNASHEAELYQYILNEYHASPGQAETACQLLLGFPEQARTRPETYETLIAYLGHAKLAVRQLAIWDLRHLVPAGRQIAYDAAGPVEQRERGIQAWKALIPAGQLPPRTRQGG